MRVLICSKTFARNISHSETSWARYRKFNRSSYKVTTILVRILIKIDRFSKNPNVKFHKNPSSDSRIVPCGRSSSSSSAICQTTGPKPLPKRFLHIMRSRTSSFNWQYPLLSLRLSSSFLRLLPRLLVTSICPFIFPSITCCRRHFLCKMWPIQLAFRFLISCRIVLC